MEHTTKTHKMPHEVAATLVTSKEVGIEGPTPGTRMERIKTSPNYQDGKFVNSIPTIVYKDGARWHMFKSCLFGDYIAPPPSKIPMKPVRPESFKALPSSGLRTIWLGHSSVLIEIDGIRLLVDPVFSKVISPVSFLGPKRFHPPPIALTDLPRIDAVMISHNHYDHFDKTTIQYLARKGTSFVVPLGIGTHLEKWNTPENQIVELDWWESSMARQVRLVCTPARHFSGRNYFDYNQTLWSSWAIIGTKRRVFHSGDTGYSDHFKEIGQRLGPFDLTLMKAGAYDSHWPDIHLNPEQAVDAHLDVRGQRMLPIHWSAYDLGPHDWNEPVKRVVQAAKQKNIDLITPHIGEIVDADLPFSSTSWWEQVK